jgi:hypothetical protein
MHTGQSIAGRTFGLDELGLEKFTKGRTCEGANPTMECLVMITARARTILLDVIKKILTIASFAARIGHNGRHVG